MVMGVVVILHSSMNGYFTRYVIFLYKLRLSKHICADCRVLNDSLLAVGCRSGYTRLLLNNVDVVSS